MATLNGTRASGAATTFLLAALQFIGCLIGGAVSASLLFLTMSLCIFGLGKFERLSQFVAAVNPVAGVLGAVAGGFIFSRSAQTSKS